MKKLTEQLNEKQSKESNKQFVEKCVAQDSKVLTERQSVQNILLILNQRLDMSRNTIHNIIISLQRKENLTLSKKTLDNINTLINDLDKDLVRIIKELDFKIGE